MSSSIRIKFTIHFYTSLFLFLLFVIVFLPSIIFVFYHFVFRQILRTLLVSDNPFQSSVKSYMFAVHTTTSSSIIIIIIIIIWKLGPENHKYVEAWQCLYIPLSRNSGRTFTRNFLKYLENIGLSKNILKVGQKAVLLQTCHRVPKFLGHAPWP